MSNFHFKSFFAEPKKEVFFSRPLGNSKNANSTEILSFDTSSFFLLLLRSLHFELVYFPFAFEVKRILEVEKKGDGGERGGGVRREDWKMAPHHWEKIFFWSEGGVATELTRKRKCILRGGWAHAQALTSKQTRPHARTHTHTHTLSSKSSLSLSHKHTHYCKKITVLHTPSPVAYSNTHALKHTPIHTH